MRLIQLIVQEAIRAKLDLESRDEVIYQAGDLLVQAGAVEPGYVKAMKRVMDELGPYCVIAPGIALLHARPEDGVIRTCLSLITLKTPVAFGHSSNDPVDIAFALGAIDKRSHIEALAELAEFLSKEDFLQSIRDAQDTASLQKSILSFLNSGK